MILTKVHPDYLWIECYLRWVSGVIVQLLRGDLIINLLECLLMFLGLFHSFLMQNFTKETLKWYQMYIEPSLTCVLMIICVFKLFCIMYAQFLILRLNKLNCYFNESVLIFLTFLAMALNIHLKWLLQIFLTACSIVKTNTSSIIY